MTRSRWTFLAFFLVSLGQQAWYLPRMPAAMATHYDAAGMPNGHMTPGMALGFHLFVLATLAFGFVVLPGLLSKVASDLINIPNRTYWLAPVRKSATLKSLCARMDVLGCATLALMIVVIEFNFRANLNPPARLPLLPFVAALAGFLAFTAGWTVSLVRRFRLPMGSVA